MGRESKASREAAAAAAPPPPPPQKAASAPAAPAKAAAPAAPKASATGAVTKPVAPKAAAPAAPAVPAPEAPAAAPMQEVAPAKPGAMTASQKLSTWGPAARKYRPTTSAPMQQSALTPKEARARMAEVLARPASQDFTARLPEYEERIARVRAMRQRGELGTASERPTPYMTTRSVALPGGGSLGAEDVRMPAGVTRSTTQVRGQTRGVVASASPEALAAPVDDTMEFARRAERLGARYAAYQSTLEELDALRQRYESDKREGRTSSGDASVRRALSEEVAPHWTEINGQQRIVSRARTPEEVDALMARETDRKLKDVAERTRAARQGAAQTAADLRQFGFTDTQDIDRAFGE